MTTFRMGPTASCIVGLYALVVMWGCFFLGIVFLPTHDEPLLLRLSVVQFSGVIASVLFFFSFAYAGDQELDERELSERNQTFVLAWRCLFLAPVLGIAIPELIAEASKVELTVGSMRNFALAVSCTIFVLPGVLLAWRARTGQV